jgi:isochorismate synthase
MSNDLRLHDALQRCLSRGLTFAAFRRPGQPAEIWAQRTAEIEHIDGALLLELNEAFVIAPFDLVDERIPFIRSDIELQFGELGPDIDVLTECQGASLSSDQPVAATDPAAFRSAVALAKSQLLSGALKKVVLSRTLTLPLDRASLPDLFIGAMHAHPDAFIALANTPLHGTWIGASPERLVYEEEDRVRVDALAGTMAVDTALTSPDAWGAKERDEQSLVTESVLSTLRGLDLRDVAISGPEVMRAGHLAHLRTNVQADLGDRTLGEVVLALHPTPAVCGTPRDAAHAFIAAHEGHQRELYAGFWGPWSPDEVTELFVNIRCMRVFADHATLHVGAGITTGSEAGAEWNETEQKAQTWLRPIAELK